LLIICEEGDEAEGWENLSITPKGNYYLITT
jgi:hypothetical protein